MTIWDPYTYRPDGQAIGAVAPPALRVHGSPASANQLGMAQAAFYRFCMMARLSVVPNPVEAGRLPDGTAYRIVRIGNSTTMEIWPASEDEDQRSSGIALVLTYLDGSVIPGHHKDGEPTVYLLTPGVTKGTRNTTGRWVVRRPPSVAGGKTVNADSSGRQYFAGVPGVSDSNVPLARTPGLSLNGQAYTHELMYGEMPVFRNFRQVAISGSSASPIPFVHTAQDGRKLAMHIGFATESAGGVIRYRMSLRAGPLVSTGTAAVGPVVWSQLLDQGLAIDFRTITFRDDGRAARATGVKGGKTALLNIAISATSLSVSVERTVPDNSKVGSAYNFSFKDEISGEPATPGYFTQHWEIFGVGDGSAEYGSTTPVNTEEIYLGPGSDYGRGDFTFSRYFPALHSYSRRGKSLNLGDSPRLTTVSSYADRYTSSLIVSVVSPTTPLHTKDTIVETSRRRDTASTLSGTRVLQLDEDLLRVESEAISQDTTTSISGGGSSYIDTGGDSVLYEDLESGVIVYYDMRRERWLAWDYVADPSTSAGYRREYTRSETKNETRFVVECRGAKLVEKDHDPDGAYRHVVFLAADPMTGALALNVQEVHAETRQTRESWIFLIDDQGAKRLSSVMGIPSGTAVKVRRNSDLISV